MEEQATPLIGEYAMEDFYTERPYLAIYNESNRFLQNVMLNRTRDLAASLGFKGFMTAWRSFLSSRQTQSAPSAATENATEFDGQPAELKCGAYSCEDNRVTRTNQFGAEVEVISHPIMPVKRITNIETMDAKLEIAFQRGRGGWKHIIVPREQLASAQKIIGLANQNIAVTSENAREVVMFLSELESRNYDDLPEQNAISHMGWLPDGLFMPYVDNITYDGKSVALEKIYRDLKPTGNRDEWMNLALKVRAGESVPARIALAAGFAAPLVSLLNALSFFVHLWGEKGCGKTVGLMLAASVWGNPELGGIAKTFNGTKVSFELHAAFCRNLPVLLDELQVINDNKKNFDDIIYMLCEGANKGRAEKTGGLQAQNSWATCMITTGETPITQDNSGGGADVRTIEVDYKGQPLFGTDEAAREASIILKRNYGYAGKEFIDALMAMGTGRERENALKRIFDRHVKAFSQDVDAKQAISAAVLLTADEIANDAIFHDGHSLTEDELREFLKSRADADVNRRAYNWIVDTITANNHRMEPTGDNYSGEVWGKIDQDGSNTVFCILNSTFSTLMRNGGFNSKSFFKWAKTNGLVLLDSTGKTTKPVRLSSLEGVLRRCVCLRVVDLDEKTAPGPGNRLHPVNVDDDLPF